MALVNVVNMVSVTRKDQEGAKEFLSLTASTHWINNFFLFHVLQVVLDNPTSFTNPFQFEITFECLQELDDGTWIATKHSTHMLSARTHSSPPFVSLYRVHYCRSCVLLHIGWFPALYFSLCALYYFCFFQTWNGKSCTLALPKMPAATKFWMKFSWALSPSV